MPELDLSFTITAIIAVTSLVSPWISNIINNRHQRKMKLLEYEQERYNKSVLYKRQIFENYVSFAEEYITHANATSLENYGKYYALAYLYAPDHIKEEMSIIHFSIFKREANVARKDLEQLMPKISVIINSIK